jgi:hypothetical protein
MKHFRNAFIVLGLLSGLASCTAPPESTGPLSAPGGTNYEVSLLGDWFGVWNASGEEHAFWQMHIRAGDTPDVLRILAISVAPEEPSVSWVQAEAHASELDGAIYYNVKRLKHSEDSDYSGEDTEPAFIIVKLEYTKDGGLALHTMDLALLHRIIEDEQIDARTIDCDNDQYCDYYLLDLSHDKLAAFIREKTPRRLFQHYPFSPHFYRSAPDANSIARLTKAIKEGNLDQVAQLVNSGLPVNAMNGDGKLPLMIAIEGEKEPIAKILIDHGAQVDATDFDDPETPLQTAVKRGNANLVSLLLEKGALADLAGIGEGSPPLHLAAEDGNLELVRLLVDGGADRETTDQYGDTAIDVARENSHDQIVEALLN